MPRIRSTKPSFFRHEKLQELELKYPNAKVMLFFSGIWGLCDNQGRFEWRPKQMKLDILPFIPYDPEETLSILTAHGFIEKYSHEGQLYGHVFNLKKHQRFTGKEVKEGERFPPPTPENIIKISKREATGKQRGSNREVKIIPSENQVDSRGSTGEASGKHLGTQEKEKEEEKEKEKETPEKEFSASNNKNKLIGVVDVKSVSNLAVGGKKNKKTVAPKTKSSDVEPFQDLYVTAFSKEWVELRKREYEWQPKDFSAIKKISKIIRK